MELHPIIDEHLFAILINCSSRVAYLLVSLKKEEKEREKKRDSVYFHRTTARRGKPVLPADVVSGCWLQMSEGKSVRAKEEERKREKEVLPDGPPRGNRWW